MKRFLLPAVLAAALPAADSHIAPALNSFTADCYRQIAHGDANLVVSPFNIATALSMALAGAGGRTAQEIQSVLHLQRDSAHDAAMASLLADLDKSGNTPGNELHMANALWLQEGFAIEPAFQGTLAKNYGAPPTLLDFMTNPEAARLEINRWTEERTKERIKNLFSPGVLGVQTRLVLTSAIYFYGKWQAPFVPSLTQPAPFTVPSGATARPMFMNQTAHFGYTETPALQILEMRYGGTGFAFDVLLPRTAGGLPDLERSLTAEKLGGWLGSLANRNVQVSLPKFRAESAFSLCDTLSTMGMAGAFADGADFSRINPASRLKISEVVHKAFVDVAEQGTEAAAATGVAMKEIAMLAPEQPVVFRADHPFLFLIRDTRAGVILFIGRLTNPK